jgi:hypothetical protein
MAAMKLPDMPDTERGIRMAAQRDGWRSRLNLAGEPLARKREGRGGGWEYHYTLLPMRAQMRLVKEITAAPDAATAPRGRAEIWDWFSRQPDKKKAVAAERAAAIRAVKVLQKGGLQVNLAVATVAHQRGVGASTLGATYVQAYEDVVDASKAEDPMDVWFSSADQSAATEYILYCGMWAKLLNVAAQDLGEVAIDDEHDIKARVVQFATGKRIHGLSSNPKAFRSKGGKLVLDEFAFHPDADALWKAAAPIITWGFPARVLSTYNGKGNRYYRMVDEAEKGNNWSVYTTTIEDAVRHGLALKIAGRPDATAEERAAIEAAFLADCRDVSGDDETYLQEFMCVPVDEATAWLTWQMIVACEHPDAGRPELYEGGDVYVGVDIGRKRDLTVIWVDEIVGDVAWTREVISMKKAKFAEQDRELDRVFGTYHVRRCCMDETGLGMKPVEDAKAIDITSTDAIAAVEGDFADTFSVDGRPGFVSDAAVDLVGKAADGILSMGGPSASSTSNIAAADITSQAGQLVRTPGTLAGRITGLVASTAGETGTGRDRVNALTSLASFGDDIAPVPETTSTRIQQAANQQATVALVRRTALIEAARSVPNVTFANQREAFDLRDELGGRLDGEMETASDPVYRGLANVRAAMVRDTNARAPGLAQVVSTTPKTTEPCLVTAYRLYGDAGQADEIAARNRLRHPGFVPGGKTLEVLTRA